MQDASSFATRPHEFPDNVAALRAAMNYVRNNWDELQTFLTDGRLPLDNNETEESMRKVAVGRKNWLFMGSVAGGERAARLMIVVSSALRNDLDVERYVTDLLRQLLAGCTGELTDKQKADLIAQARAKLLGTTAPRSSEGPTTPPRQA